MMTEKTRTQNHEPQISSEGSASKLQENINIDQKIDEIIKNSEMFDLPNKQRITSEKLESTVEALYRQYALSLKLDEEQNEVKAKIDNLSWASDNIDDILNNFKDILEKAPHEAVSALISNLRYLPEARREEFARLALEKAPQEAASALVRDIRNLPEAVRKEFARLALEKAPQEAAPVIIDNLRYLPEARQEEFARLALEKAPQETASTLIENLDYLPEARREELARLTLEKAPQEAASTLMSKLKYLPEARREELARLALEKAPQEAASTLMSKLKYLPEARREELARLALEKAPQEAASVLMVNLRYLPEAVREELALLALEKAPQEAASTLIGNLEYLPEARQEEFARLALEKAPQEAASAFMYSLKYLPEARREELARLALEKAPQEAVSALIWDIRYLPEAVREEFARLALEKGSQEVASALIYNIEYLPEARQEELKNKAKEILRIIERNIIEESERINPILYEEIEDLEKQFSRKEFPKSGTRTVLLGGTLINNVILRIIPNHAFITWTKVYSAVEDWKKAGFDYVPIEPILKASSSKDGKDVRVYAGVLGVSVYSYLQMKSNKENHKIVQQQVKTIEKTLKAMGVSHGHTHLNNFCVLHERTQDGEIDWSKPPRVYCIDFDESISS